MDPAEEKRAYFERTLRTCLTELVTSCLKHRPGVTKGDDLPPDRYASEVLDPLFQRLASECIENQPRDPFSFIKNWALTQKELTISDSLRDFVASWCTSRMDEFRARDARLAELEQKHIALTTEVEVLKEENAKLRADNEKLKDGETSSSAALKE